MSIHRPTGKANSPCVPSGASDGFLCTSKIRCALPDDSGFTIEMTKCSDWILKLI